MRLNQLKIDKFAYTESDTEPKKKKKMTEDQIKNKIQLLPGLEDILNVSNITMPTSGDSKSANSSISALTSKNPEKPSTSGIRISASTNSKKESANLMNLKKTRNSSIFEGN